MDLPRLLLLERDDVVRIEDASWPSFCALGDRSCGKLSVEVLDVWY
jgi:hypothetical protein